MKATTEPVNMTKEYRSELKAPARARTRLLKRDAAKVGCDAEKEIRAIVRETEKTFKGIANETASINKRRLILEGRLAK